MKRGLIHWDKTALPEAVFDSRLQKLRDALISRDLPAAIVYADIWRSNQARFFSNLMMYWNRSLLVVPQRERPILICGLSPRVYPWIRSVTVLDDIRPNTNPARGVLQFCTESQWKRIGVLDLPRLPQDLCSTICSASIETVNVPPEAIYTPGADAAEIRMRRRAAAMARQIAEEEMPKGVGTLDHEFVGRLERAFRREGAEDLVILLSDGRGRPRPAMGITLKEGYSLSLALEYQGHWIKLSRPQVAPEAAKLLQNRFRDLADDPKSQVNFPAYAENLSGPYPYEPCDRSAIDRGWIFALHAESDSGGGQAFYGDTCWYGPQGVEVL